MAHVSFRTDTSDLAKYSLMLDEVQERSGQVRKIISQASHGRRIKLVDPLIVLCEEGRCPVDDGEGNPRYEDSNHLSYIGAVALVRLLGSSLF